MRPGLDWSLSLNLSPLKKDLLRRPRRDRESFVLSLSVYWMVVSESHVPPAGGRNDVLPTFLSNERRP